MGTTYDEALRFLYSFVNYERIPAWKYSSPDFNLNKFRDFLKALGNPHERGRFVHVAGTNGKGSVSSMIASAFIEAGLRTGLYTSPHLVTFRERIRIDGSFISKDDVVSEVTEMEEVCGCFPELTFFEVWTALAFSYFLRKKTDASVFEVGLGGRLDATNVLTPSVSVITSIGIDHRMQLGDTIEAITREKAGIIKPGVPVVSAPQDERVVDILDQVALEQRAQLVLVGRDVSFYKVNSGICYSGIKWRLDPVFIPLDGVMQHENAAAALAALELLAERGFPVDESVAIRGIGNVKWPGRLQEIAQHPVVIVDGACNTDAMTVVHEYITSRAPRERVVAVVGMNRDKEVADVLAVLAHTASHFVLTAADNPRALMPNDLAALSPETATAEVCGNPVEALAKARSRAGSDGLVLVTGSLYLVGEIMKYYGIGEVD